MLRSPLRRGKFTTFLRVRIQLSKNEQKPDEAVLKLCCNSLFHQLYGPKMDLRDIKR